MCGASFAGSLQKYEAHVMNSAYLKRIYWQLTGLTMAAMIIALAAISAIAHGEFEDQLVPEMAKKATTVGASVRALVQKATGYGVDYRALYGVEGTFEEVRSENPEFGYMAMTDERGHVLYQFGSPPAGAQAHFTSPEVLRAQASANDALPAKLLETQYMVSMPVGNADKPLGMLHIGIDQNFVQRLMLEVVLDIVVVLIVALFFTLELLHFIAGGRLEAGFAAFSATVERIRGGDFTMRPKRAATDEVGRVIALVNDAVGSLNERYQALATEVKNRLGEAGAARREELRPALEAFEALGKRFSFGPSAAVGEEPGALAKIRAPLFIFILAEELTRSFLPSYIGQLLVPIPGLSPQIVIGLPIALFMLIVAIGQPFLGAWSERVGRRRAMLTGALFGTIGFAATAFAHNLLDLLLWRSICALGYGMVFVAAQGYVLEHTGPKNRTQGFALFVGAIMVATICGPSIGGILADNIGYRSSFIVSAVLCGLSVFAMLGLPGLQQRAGNPARSERPPTLSDFGRLLINRRFMTLSGLAAVPAKIILTAFCFYLVPLYIVYIGSTQSMAGRMLMVYAVMMVLIVPIAARYADAGARRDRLVAAGLCLSGLGGFLLLVHDNFLMVFGVVFLLGLGQALSIAAQGTLVGELCREEIKEFGDGSVYGTYRLLERLGNAAGPLLAGVLVVRYGYQSAFVAISALVLVCGVLFAIATGAYRRTAA
jgi:MFS family permease